MNTFPLPFEERMKIMLREETDAFFNALQSEAPVSVRLNPGKRHAAAELFPHLQPRPVAWCPSAYYLNQRPVFTLDPHFHGGVYYVQEASSMFLHHILKQLTSTSPLRVLDLCAAPGGKSTLLASFLPEESLLVSNEVIRSRAAILKENMIKWGQDNIVITNNDPADFAALKECFDIIVADAPCSGEGMFRKDPEAIREWSEKNLRLCSERQKRILSDSWDCLKPGGFMIYSTCTYNRDENEAIIEWLIKEFEAESIRINHTFNEITPGDSNCHCYRFYPHKTCGEGFFTAVLRKTSRENFSFRKNKKQNSFRQARLSPELMPMLSAPDKYIVYDNGFSTGILPATHAAFISLLEHQLKIIYKGCEIAESNTRKIKLMPSFALWQGLKKENCTIYETNRDIALAFLKKEDIPSTTLHGDWILVSYQHTPLGWCKNLGNRLNNYYPKEWRIRMQINAGTENS